MNVSRPGRVDPNQTRMLLEELIRIDSVNPGSDPSRKGEAEIARWIGTYLERLGLEIRFQEVEPGRPNVIARLRGSGGGSSLMLNGHIDTVGIGKMEIPPFEPVFRDGKVYGRGSFDMKGGIAAIMMCAQSLVERKERLKGDLILTLVMDEEYANVGTDAVVREYKADGAIVCEPTYMEIGVAHKGWGWERIDVYGKAAHGSMPELGVDAIVKAGKVLVAIDGLGRRLMAGTSHPLLGVPSIHGGRIAGGSHELNTYPAHCVIELERRTLPGETKETVTGEIEAILEAFRTEDPQFKADYDLFIYRPALETPSDSPVVRSLATSFEAYCGKSPRLTGFSGWADSATLSEAGIPAVLFGPAGEGAHAPVEWVDFQSVVDTAEILIDTAIDFCGSAEDSGLI